MTRPHAHSPADIAAWLTTHAGWRREGEALVKDFTFADFSAALGFVVRVGLAAEKNDHHPDIRLGWGKAQVLWTTHDAGGITALDTKLAETSDTLAS